MKTEQINAIAAKWAVNYLTAGSEQAETAQDAIAAAITEALSTRTSQPFASEPTPESLTEAALRLEDTAEPELVGLMLAAAEKWRKEISLPPPSGRPLPTVSPNDIRVSVVPVDERYTRVRADLRVSSQRMIDGGEPTETIEYATEVVRREVWVWLYGEIARLLEESRHTILSAVAADYSAVQRADESLRAILARLRYPAV